MLKRVTKILKKHNTKVDKIIARFRKNCKKVKKWVDENNVLNKSLRENDKNNKKLKIKKKQLISIYKRAQRNK